MLHFRFGMVAIAATFIFTGCAGTTAKTTAVPAASAGRPVASGLKPASQVAACCKALAEGRITIAQCMENPACKANNRACCMQAIQ